MQSRPDYGRGLGHFLAKVFELFEGIPFSLGSGDPPLSTNLFFFITLKPRVE